MALISCRFARLTGWPPPLLLVTVIMQTGMCSAPTRAINVSSLCGSRLPFEGMAAPRIYAFVDYQIDSLSPRMLNVGAGGIEVVVAGNDLTGTA